MIEDQNLTDNRLKKRRIALIHKVYISQLKTQRKYTASTKTKSEVRGGGRKPWRQKGTGQARAGSTRSPLWVGGGVIFGPRKDRIVTKKVNKKERKLAIVAAFYLKNNQTKIIDPSLLENSMEFKSKKIDLLLKNLSIPKDEKTLIILPKMNKLFYFGLRNIPNVEITLANSLNLKQLLNSKNILLSKDSVNLINEIYGRKTKREIN